MEDIREIPIHYGVFWVSDTNPNSWGDYTTSDGYPHCLETKFAGRSMHAIRFIDYESAEAFVVDQRSMFRDEYNRKGYSLFVGEIVSEIRLRPVTSENETRVIYNKAVSKLTSEELAAIKSMIKNGE